MNVTKGLKRGVGAAVAAAAMLAVALIPSGSAMADTHVDVDTAATASLVITGASASLGNHTFKAIKVATYSDAQADGADLKSVSVTTPSGYKTSMIAAYLAANGTAIPSADEKQRDGQGCLPMAWLPAIGWKLHGFTSNASGGGWQGKLRDFVTALAARTDIKADIASSGYAVTAGSSATSVTLTGLPIGLYLVVDTTGAGSTTAVAGTNAPASIPILAGTVLMSTAPQTYSKFKDDTAMTLGTVTVKNNVPTIKKKLVAPNYGSASIGDELTYQLIGSVPLTTGFSHYTYKLTDLPHSGLTYVPGSVSIRIANSEYAPDASALKTLTEGAVGAVGTDYAVTVTPGDGGQVAFNLSPGIVAIGHQYYGRLIRVEYKMKVNDTATTSADMINGFKLSYSNDTGNPPAADNGDDTNTDGTVTTITDTNPGDPVALHFYHFQMEVQAKIDSTTKLSGATFQILDPVSGDPMLFKKLADGSYKKVGNAGNTVGVNDVVDTLTSATGGLGGLTTGQIKVDGLGSNTYTVKEITVSTGYGQPFASTFTVTINVSGTNSLTAPKYSNSADLWNLVQSAEWYTADEDTHLIVVQEVNSFAQLPMTGGAGAIVVGLAVVALLGVAGAIFIYTRRSEKSLNREG